MKYSLPLRGRRNVALFLSVVAVFSERSSAVPSEANRGVSGIVVPHHVVAADLIERGFRCAEGGDYNRVILLCPDHFRRSPAPFATTRADLSSATATVRTDTSAVAALLRNPLVCESDLFAREHGVSVLIPFLHRFFPDAVVVPVALRIDSDKSDWDSFLSALEPLFTERTLIVQSTDFSHYLPLRQARRHDQQTMNALAMGDPRAVLSLSQPQHLDSIAAQYVHAELQKRRGNAGPVVLANRNSQQYSPVTERQTTSYIVQVYQRAGTLAVPWPDFPGDETWLFAGDVFLGRNLSRVVADPEKRAALRDRVLAVTAGKPLVVNLEGVLVPHVRDPRSQRILAMEQDHVAEFLEMINVKIASLANNHSFDAGSSGLANTVKILAGHGIRTVTDGDVLDAGRFRIVALSDLCNRRSPFGGRISPESVRQLSLGNRLRFPSFAFVHWGREFEAAPGGSQQRIAGWLAETPLDLVLGSHPHVPSAGVQTWKNGEGLVVWSLGNFLFDQPQGSGSLVEVRFFGNGTFAARSLPVGNILTNSAIPQALLRDCESSLPIESARNEKMHAARR